MFGTDAQLRQRPLVYWVLGELRYQDVAAESCRDAIARGTVAGSYLNAALFYSHLGERMKIGSLHGIPVKIRLFVMSWLAAMDGCFGIHQIRMG